MPPKAKFTKSQIVSAALDIIKRDGAEALTARSLGNELGSSARPIFTVFESMNDVQEAATKAATALYNEYVGRGLNEVPAFKGVGQAYIKFASEQPKLFQLLFMREQSSVPDKNSVLGILDFNSNKILQSIQDGYGLDEIAARDIYLHLWIYSHGIAVLIATKVCSFSDDEISDMLTQVFISMLKKIKAEKISD